MKEIHEGRNHKTFTISGDDKAGYCIWWKDTGAASASYVLGSRRNARTWKTLEGARKFVGEMAEGLRPIPASY